MYVLDDKDSPLYFRENVFFFLKVSISINNLHTNPGECNAAGASGDLKVIFIIIGKIKVKNTQAKVLG